MLTNIKQCLKYVSGVEFFLMHKITRQIKDKETYITSYTHLYKFVYNEKRPTNWAPPPVPQK